MSEQVDSQIETVEDFFKENFKGPIIRINGDNPDPSKLILIEQGIKKFGKQWNKVIDGIFYFVAKDDGVLSVGQDNTKEIYKSGQIIVRNPNEDPWPWPYGQEESFFEKYDKRSANLPQGLTSIPGYNWADSSKKVRRLGIQVPEGFEFQIEKPSWNTDKPQIIKSGGVIVLTEDREIFGLSDEVMSNYYPVEIQ